MMKTKKPDIFLGITMAMLVLAAVLCLIILFVQNSQKNNSSTTPAGTDTLSSDVVPGGDATGSPNNSGSPIDPNQTENPDNPVVTPTDKPVDPVNLAEIDAKGLKAALDERLTGLVSDFQVVVIDPALGTKVESIHNTESTDSWMKGNSMVSVFVMGTVYQQIADGKLKEADVLEDVKAMIVKSDMDAVDRLTEKVGGMEAVKSFANSSGLKLGYNITMAGVGAKPYNYVSALQMATILEKIYKGELVSKDASAKMLEILCTPKESEALDLGITDPNTKYGFVTGSKQGDYLATMGIVRQANRSYIISIICNDPKNMDSAKDIFHQLLERTAPFFAD